LSLEKSPLESAPRQTRLWRVGTLLYTPAALVSLFLWLLWGDFAWSMRDRSVGPMAQWYLDHLCVPNFLFGLLISSFPALVGLVLGPIISVKSDRHRGPRGRRIPFLLATTPVGALGMIGLALTPVLVPWLHGVASSPGGGWLPAFFRNETVLAIFCFGLFWAAFEFATIAANAVFGGLVNDVVPAPLLGRFYGLFRAVSLVDGMVFQFWLMGKVPNHFTAILLTIGFFYGVAFTWVCLKVKEGEYPPPPVETRSSRPIQGFFSEAKRYGAECFSHPYYFAIFLLMTTAALAFGPINTFNMPYARSVGIGMETYGKYLALTYLISLGLSFVLGWLADLFHPLRTTMAALAGYALVSAWGSLYAKTAETFLTAWVLHGVLSGCYFTSAASLGQRLFPRSRFAQFASAAGVCLSLGTMILGPLTGSIIDGSGNRYRYTFAIGCGLSLLALAAACYVHGRFMKLGGPKHYMAPDA